MAAVGCSIRGEAPNSGYRLKMKKPYLLLFQQKSLSSHRVIQSFKLTSGKFGSEGSLGAPYGAISGNISYCRQVATLSNCSGRVMKSPSSIPKKSDQTMKLFSWVMKSPDRVAMLPSWIPTVSDRMPKASSSSSIRKTFKKLYEQKDLVRNNKDQYGVICDNI